jgi:hypothetical protein
LAQTAQQFASSRRRRRSAGEAQAGCPQGNPNAAFCNVIVKNQQGLGFGSVANQSEFKIFTSEFSFIP